MIKILTKILFSILLSLLTSCTLIEPTCLVIENQSDYLINVSCNRGNRSKIELEDGDDDFILAYPGELEIKVYIPSIKLSKKYEITLNYLEKKKFIFSAKEI